jgi:hypothetical protein
MTRNSVTFSYGGRSFTFAEDADKVMKGKLACDCTRSALIREYCDSNFPALRCGDKIALVSFVELIAEPARFESVVSLR